MKKLLITIGKLYSIIVNNNFLNSKINRKNLKSSQDTSAHNNNKIIILSDQKLFKFIILCIH
jgi:hypothetical protein